MLTPFYKQIPFRFEKILFEKFKKLRDDENVSKEEKVKLIQLISELVKFGILDAQGVLNFIKSYVDQADEENIYFATLFIDNCGGYFNCLSEFKMRFTIVLKKL